MAMLQSPPAPVDRLSRKRVLSHSYQHGPTFPHWLRSPLHLLTPATHQVSVGLWYQKRVDKGILAGRRGASTEQKGVHATAHCPRALQRSL